LKTAESFGLTINRIAEQFAAVATNLGQTPDILAIAPRRYGALEMGPGRSAWK